MNKYLLILLCAVTALGQQTVNNLIVKTNLVSGVIRLSGIDFPQGTYIASDEQDLAFFSPEKAGRAIIKTGTASGDWYWDSTSVVAAGDGVIEANGYLVGRWIRSYSISTPNTLSGSFGVVFNGAKQLVQSEATKQQVDKGAMQVPTVAAMRALTASQINDGQLIQTGGRLVNGDGAGRTYYWVSSSTNPTNLVGVFAPLSGGTGRFVWTESGDLTPQLAGAVVDGTTDNTTEIQAAIDYGEANGLPLYSPVTEQPYRVTSLTCETIQWYGVLPQRERIQVGTSTIHAQLPSATGPLVRVRYTRTAKPRIADMAFVGMGDVITPNKKAITSVADRFTFGVATGDAPQLGTSPSFPKQVAFFYTSEDRYLGSAFITGTSVVGANTIATVDPEWDNFATPLSSGYLLNTACKVVWSPVYTNNVGNLYPNPAIAGYPCFEVIGGLSGTFQNLLIAKFHTGIYTIGDITPYWFYDGSVRMNYMEFAGMASALPYQNADSVGMGSLIISGAYVKPGANVVSYPDETIPLSLSLARNTSFGFYNPFSGSGLADIRTDQCVAGYHSAWEIANYYGYALFDNCIRYGLSSENGFYGDILGTGLHINMLQARRYFIGTNQTGTFYTNSAAVRVKGSSFTNNISLGAIDFGVNYQGGSTNYWKWGFDISGLRHNVQVAAKQNVTGVENLQRSTNFPVRWLNPYSITLASDVRDGWYTPDYAGLTFAQGGTNIFAMNSSGVWLMGGFNRIGPNAPTPDGQYGFYSLVETPGNATTAYGYFFRANLTNGVSTETGAMRIRAEVPSGITQPIVNGVTILNPSGGGTITRNVGLTVVQQTAGTTANYNARFGASAGSVGPVGTYNVTFEGGRDVTIDGNLSFSSGKGPSFTDGSFVRGTTNYLAGASVAGGGLRVGTTGDLIKGTFYSNGTLVAGTVVIANGNIGATSKLTPYLVTAGGTPGALYISSKGTGTCTITSTSATDTSVVGILIVN